MTIYQAVVDLVGTPPTGTEPLIYIFCLLVALFLMDSITSFLVAVFRGK